MIRADRHDLAVSMSRDHERMDEKALPWGLEKDTIAPASTKGLTESKLQAFEVGSMSVGKKQKSKRELEESRRKLDQVEAAQVYEEFVASFENAGKQPKTWVKGGTVHSDKATSHKGDTGRIYKPKSKLAELASTFQSVKDLKKEYKEHEDSPETTFIKKKKDEKKKKSNLEMFKEELKRIQEEREERHKFKKSGGRGPGPMGMSPSMEAFNSDDFDPKRLEPNLDIMADLSTTGHSDFNSDENTTNIYIGNINPKMTEKQLMDVFGKYGPLASIKIMWPRSEEERSRGRNCGFVAFMNRKDGERAMNTLKGKEICGFEMKLGWGKAVPIPPHPVYIPPALAELTLPPPPSGLPFNAQPNKSKRGRERGGFRSIDDEEEEDLEERLSKAVVKVVIPTERTLLCVIHRMVEFVVREGPMFEAMIMNRELNNSLFKFLFDNQSPAHIYYRWKLYTILNGDLPYKWRTDEFRMFRRGSYWKPPPMNPYTQGMPEELVEGMSDTLEGDVLDENPVIRGKLTDSQRDRLEDLLRELSPERPAIGEAMIWCLDHAEAAEEVADCIAESLSILQTPVPKKIARLFLVSDILFNSSAKVPNASFYRKHFQRKLVEIYRDVHDTYENIDGRLKAEQFKQKVMLIFRAWEDWTVYPNDFLINLQNIFLGLVPKTQEKPELEEKADLDGAPLEDPDIDGAPLVLGTSEQQNGRQEEEKLVMKVIKADESADLDGVPMGEDLDGEPIKDEDSDIDGKPLKGTSQPQATPKFARSKWEEVDETELEAQAMTTSKWDLLEENDNKPEEDEDLDGKPIEEENIDGQEMSDDGGYKDNNQDKYRSERSDRSERSEKLEKRDRRERSEPMTEERRAKLREIESKVIKYQDDLEAGRRSRKHNMSLSEQIQNHRKKLLAKEFSESPVRESRKRHRSRSYSPVYSRYEESPKRSKRAKSPKKSRRSRSRSRSPYKRSLSRSPSRHRRKSKKKHRD